MNAKISIKTTLKALDTWLEYVKSSGWDVREKKVGNDSVYYYSDNLPGYGKLTALASVIRDQNNRPTVWIFIRLPLHPERPKD